MFNSRDSLAASSSGGGGKKDENRRTLTDFKLVGLEIKDLDWAWGVMPGLKTSATSPQDSTLASNTSESTTVTVPSDSIIRVEESSTATRPSDATATDVKQSQVAPLKAEATIIAKSEPPSRVRIYFHTPVSADDAHPVSHAPSFAIPGALPSDSRKGKRKLEDDEGDDEGRSRRPPPQISVQGAPIHHLDEQNPGSAAPSIADTTTASEGDWLMAAIGEGHEEEEDYDADDLQTGHTDEPIEGYEEDASGESYVLQILMICVIGASRQRGSFRFGRGRPCC
jgi:20S proteasome subunit alpha 6